MPDRIQVQDLYKDRGYLPAIQPTASPVDTFVDPGRPVIKDTALLELAAAWSEVEPGLSQFTQQRIAHANQLEIEEGRKAALANKAAFKEAVAKGQIPAGASPWFQVGYERQRATRSALEYDQAMRDAYAQTNLADDSDPAAISKFMSEFTAGWLEENEGAKDNPEFGRVFQVLGAKAQDNLQSIHAAERTKRIEQGLIDDTDFMLGAVLDRSFDPLGNNNPHLSQELATIVGEQVANGLSGQVANKLVTDAVIRKALSEQDITILDVLDTVPSGSGVVGKIGWVEKAKEAARLQIAQLAEHQNRIDSAALKEQRTQIINQVRGQAYLKIADNPYADVSQEFGALVAIDPDEAAKLESFRTAYLGSKNAQNKVIESNPLKTEMLLQALKGDLTEDQVALSVENGLIDYETAKDLLTNHITVTVRSSPLAEKCSVA
jgi:hypothetical protein